MVTGGAGFIGGHLVEALAARGTSVAVIDDLSSGKRENVPRGVKIYEVDVRDGAAVTSAFREIAPTHVFHLAAQASVKVSVEQPVLDATINVVGGLQVLEACRATGVHRIVFASTGGALYGEVPEGESATEARPMRPKSPYAVSKASFELYLEAYAHLHGLRFSTLRYANVFGPRQDPHGEAGVVAIFARRLLERQPLKLYARTTPGDDGCVRDYVYVADVVAANLAVLDGDIDGTFNVCSGVGRATRDVLSELRKHVDGEPEIVMSGPRPGDLERSVLDPGLLSMRGFRPRVSFEEGIRRTLEWFRSPASRST
jgi:UDP-glucose 4-epimerase